MKLFWYICFIVLIMALVSIVFVGNDVAKFAVGIILSILVTWAFLIDV